MSNEADEVYWRLLNPCEMLGFPGVWECGIHRFVKITTDEIVALHLRKKASDTAKLKPKS